MKNHVDLIHNNLDIDKQTRGMKLLGLHPPQHSQKSSSNEFIAPIPTQCLLLGTQKHSESARKNAPRVSKHGFFLAHPQ